MVDAQTISIIFAGVSIGVAAIYYTLTLRNTQRAQQLQLETRQAQLFMQIYNRMDEDFSDAVWEIQSAEFSSFKEYMENYGPETNRDFQRKRRRLATFYEGIGVLVREGYLNIRLVALVMAGGIRVFWEKFEPIIDEFKEFYNYPRWMSETEYLYNELMKYTDEHPELKT